MKITCIGNCQTLSLCFYLQELLESDNISWLLYGQEFKRHLGPWSDKIKNKIIDYESRHIDEIKESDVIIYQEISVTKSSFSNYEKLQEIKKDSCKLIKIPSIYLDSNNYETSLKELKRRETDNKVDVTVTDFFEKLKITKLMLSIDHPTTFLFLEIMKKICNILNIEFFTQKRLIVFYRKIIIQTYLDYSFINSRW